MRAAKYIAFFRHGVTQTRAEPAELYGRVVFFFIILGVFSALWRAVADAGMPLGESPRTMVWYLAMTEWVLLSAPLIQFQIEEDVRRGDVAYQIARPVSYLGAHFAQATGALAVRAPVLLAAAVSAGWIFGGGLPEDPSRLTRTIAFGAAGMVVMTAFNLVLGLLAFWLGDIAPVHWIWQKLTFVLGGLMLPLSLYPTLVTRIARATPFPALLAGPASFMLGKPLMSALELSVWLAGWMGVAALLGRIAFRSATRTLHVNGG